MHRKDEQYNKEISFEKISDCPVKDYIIIGRCYFNQNIILKLKENKDKGVLKILDIDEIFNY